MFKRVSRILAIAMLIPFLFTLTVFASAGLEGKELNLVSEDSGYSIIVPNFVELKNVDFWGETHTVVVMETPEKDSNGNYPIFEIVTTDENAYKVYSYPGILDEGQLGEFTGTFKDGRLVYSPKFFFSDELKDLENDYIFVFDFSVFDKDFNMIFGVSDLNFIFVDKTESSAEELLPVTARPTSSKVTVDGKEEAFEAYNINGNNFFKLRDLAMVLNGTDKQFEVSWDGEKNAINITTGSSYTPEGNELTISKSPSDKKALPTRSKIYIDGTETQFTAYNINGNNYFKLRDIAEKIDFGVTWDGKLNQIIVDTTVGYTPEE